MGERSQTFLRILVILSICFLAVWSWREIQYRMLPLDEVRLFPPDMSEVMEIPPRPGVRGLMMNICMLARKVDR